MKFLILEANNEDTRLLDQSISRSLINYGGYQVKTLDPCAIYEQEGSAGLEAAIENVVYEDKIDVFICCAFGMWMELNPEFIYHRLSDCYRVYIVGDDEGHFELFDRYNGQAYDLVISANPLVERYHLYQIDAEYYPSVYPAHLFCPSDENQNKKHDVSFIGAVKGKTGREAGIAMLEGAGISVESFGFGTKNGPISNEGALSLYRHSRINLNFTGTWRSPLAPNDTIMHRVRAVKGRCTKIALCGSFVLSEYAPGIERLFDVGREIDVFRDRQELVEKVHYYLEHEEVREQMAARAHARATEYYDEAKYWARVGECLERRMLVQRASKKDRLLMFIDKPFWSSYGACRFKYLVIFLFAGRFFLFLHELRLLIRAGRFNLRAAVWFAATGLHIARQRSRFAAGVAALARGVRRLFRQG
ncbi:glycosyltransferase [Candidatus Nitronereus thalassa]|uniref:Glycosyltransferase n=1 Tax=Candidatus Nitronereus thalassa TaxID=3020898 RepID=A0ABU3K5L2_9BACT|nr:glycosyltransferase [Candidatus Nitronereus thalassa]MDT7041666.1 glycosyltransferase [Candidatus Nitronereus thalassa]